MDLSGGQWQKVALARAIYAAQHGRRLLIMDEPTAHLDAALETDFYDRVVRTLSGVTIVMISHRLSTVRSADRIVLLEAGRVVEQGTHADLMAAAGLVRPAVRAPGEPVRRAATGRRIGVRSRERLGLLRRMLALCFRVRPGATVAIIVLLVAEAVAVAGLAYAQGSLVDGAPGGLTGQVIAAVRSGRCSTPPRDAGWRIQHSLKYDVADAVELELAQDLLGWTSRSATIEHLEEPEYLDKLTVCCATARCWPTPPGPCWRRWRRLGALVVSVVVLAQIHPLLMALALFGLPPILLAGGPATSTCRPSTTTAPRSGWRTSCTRSASAPSRSRSCSSRAAPPVVDQRAAGCGAT